MVQFTGFTVDDSRADPLFRQIADQIVARIENGAFPQGFRLPPTRALAQELGTHRNTVVRAYEVLSDAGWVASAVGRGTFVAAQPDHRPQIASPALTPRPTPLRWENLLSGVSRSEVLSRTARLPGARSKRAAALIDFATMQPSTDLLPDREFRLCMDHVLRTLGPRALGYAPREGLGRLREQLVIDLASRGVPARPEEIIVTTGSQQAIDLLARGLVDPGDAFAVDAETYTGAINLFTMAGARLVPIPSDEEGPEIDALDRFAATSSAKGIYLMPNCRNPTGGVISASRRRELTAWSHRTGLPIVEDDYDADLSLDDGPAPPAMRALDSDVLHVSTFSKRLIPALRVGFVVCPQGLRGPLIALKHAMDLGTSALLQHALAEFLERGYMRSHLRRILPAYRARRDALEEALTQYMPEDIGWNHLGRGMVLWLALPSDVRAGMLFVEAQRAGVLVAPSTLHTVSGHDQSGVRITIATESPERITKGVELLAEAIRKARQTGFGPSSFSGI